MKTIEFGESGFVHLSWHSVSVWIAGLSFDFGWFHGNMPLMLLQLGVGELAEDSAGAAGITILRLQILYFLFVLSAHWR